MLRDARFTLIADAPSIWGSNRCPHLELPKAKMWGALQQGSWFCEHSWGPQCRGLPLSGPDDLPFRVCLAQGPRVP